MNNKLVVIEGLDGAGKTTQLEMLKESLGECRFITFPYYESSSGMLIKEYLTGKFDEKDESVSAYSASVFYAADRYTSFRTDWGADWNLQKPIISARYVSSNAIYQMTKLEKSEWNNYLSWLYDLEYTKLALPKPSEVIFLDVPLSVSQKQLSGRYDGNEQKKDIHERNSDYMEKCRQSALFLAEKENWKIISCIENGMMRSKEDINTELKSRITGIINA